MDAILQGIKNLDGVLGALAIGPAGQVVGYKVNPVYDVAMVEQVAAAVATTLDSLVLAQEDWDSVTANFADGRLLLRNLSVNGAASPNGLRALVVIAESRINLSFAGVAIRVAVGKLKSLPAASAAPPPAPLAPASPLSSSPGLGSSGSLPLVSGHSQSQPQMQSDLSNTGLSWSGASGSSLAASGVSVTDAASAAFLTTCTKALARSLGPMAKAFVKDSIRKLWPGRAFSLDLGAQLVSELERHIEDPGDRVQFRKAVKPV